MCTHKHSHDHNDDNDDNDDKTLDVENIVKSEKAIENNVEAERLF